MEGVRKKKKILDRYRRTDMNLFRQTPKKARSSKILTDTQNSGNSTAIEMAMEAWAAADARIEQLRRREAPGELSPLLLRQTDLPLLDEPTNHLGPNDRGLEKHLRISRFRADHHP